jgi:hypothetical protein
MEKSFSVKADFHGVKVKIRTGIDTRKESISGKEMKQVRKLKPSRYQLEFNPDFLK